MLADAEESIQESMMADRDRSRVIPTASDAPEHDAECDTGSGEVSASASDAAFLKHANELLALNARDMIDDIE